MRIPQMPMFPAGTEAEQICLEADPRKDLNDFAR